MARNLLPRGTDVNQCTWASMPLAHRSRLYPPSDPYEVGIAGPLPRRTASDGPYGDSPSAVAHQLGRQRVPGASGDGPRSSRAQRLPQTRRLDELGHPSGEVAAQVRVEETARPPVVHEVERAAGGGGDHREPRGGALLKGLAEGLLRPGVHEDVEGGRRRGRGRLLCAARGRRVAGWGDPARGRQPRRGGCRAGGRAERAGAAPSPGEASDYPRTT